jgi:hypothetical protein
VPESDGMIQTLNAAIQEETHDWCEAHKDSALSEPEDILEDPALQQYLQL